MIVKITELKRSDRETKAGTQTGIKVSGIKFKDGVEDGDWDRFFADQFDSTIIQGLEQIGVGGMADLKMERKEGTKFWNAVSVRPYIQGGGKAAGGYTQTATTPSITTPTTVNVQELGPEDSGRWRRETALEQALQLSIAAIHAGSFKKGATFDLLTIETLGAAEAFDKFLEGKGAVPEPDPSAIEEGTEDSDVVDDDIPF